MTGISDHLRGPWRAVLVHKREVIDSLDGLPPEAEVAISIRRGAALPAPDGFDMPSNYKPGDVIELWDYLYVSDGDPSTDAPARWEQAKAMAAGLNAATEVGGSCKCGFRAPELGPHPACPVHTNPVDRVLDVVENWDGDRG